MYSIENSSSNLKGLTFSLSEMVLNNDTVNLVPIPLESLSENLRPSYTILNPMDDVNSSIQLNEANIDYNLKEIVHEETDNQKCFYDSKYSSSHSHDQGVIFHGNQNSNIHANDFVNRDFDISSNYQHVSFHWFYCAIIDGLAEWKPFSFSDSNKLELKYCKLFSENESDDDYVATDGGNYDVSIMKRHKISVYWEEPPMEIRRASWFYRPEDENRIIPYTEAECDFLEKTFKTVIENNWWHKSFGFDSKSEGCLEDKFIFHSPNTIVQYRRYMYGLNSVNSDEITKGRIVYRSIDAFRNLIDDDENENIDHVLFVVHGIGPICDMKCRGIIDCVKHMKQITKKLVQSHFPKRNGRIEFLPVSWHGTFHSQQTNVDKDLSKITLKSVPKLRGFTNSTLVDVLCYSSQKYCHTILRTVANEMNRLRHLFISRNPSYGGCFSLIGHSLGSVILFDLVNLQNPNPEENASYFINSETIPKLEFDVGCLFALGSPISLFLTSRGQSFLGEEYSLPSCKGFFNIFHPFDPVAYRIEPMIVCDKVQKPVVIPHHKGRKRLHLELKENLARVGSDIKSKLFQTLKTTWNSLQEFATSHKSSDSELDDMVNMLSTMDNNVGERDDTERQSMDLDSHMGMINHGRRVDYVLQEAPIESFNDYLFALSSHACYWESEDTLLMIAKETYQYLNTSSNELSGNFCSSKLQQNVKSVVENPTLATDAGSKLNGVDNLSHTVFKSSYEYAGEPDSSLYHMFTNKPNPGLQPFLETPEDQNLVKDFNSMMTLQVESDAIILPSDVVQSSIMYDTDTNTIRQSNLSDFNVIPKPPMMSVGDSFDPISLTNKLSLSNHPKYVSNIPHSLMNKQCAIRPSQDSYLLTRTVGVLDRSNLPNFFQPNSTYCQPSSRPCTMDDLILSGNNDYQSPAKDVNDNLTYGGFKTVSNTIDIVPDLSTLVDSSNANLPLISVSRSDVKPADFNEFVNISPQDDIGKMSGASGYAIFPTYQKESNIPINLLPHMLLTPSVNSFFKPTVNNNANHIEVMPEQETLYQIEIGNQCSIPYIPNSNNVSTTDTFEVYSPESSLTSCSTFPSKVDTKNILENVAAINITCTPSPMTTMLNAVDLSNSFKHSANYADVDITNKSMSQYTNHDPSLANSQSPKYGSVKTKCDFKTFVSGTSQKLPTQSKSSTRNLSTPVPLVPQFGKLTKKKLRDH